MVTDEQKYISLRRLGEFKELLDLKTAATLNGKQDALTTEQQNAVDSGINSTKVEQYDAIIPEIVDSGAKNKLIFDDITRKDINGDIFTLNSDGNIVINMTESSSDEKFCQLSLNGSTIALAQELCSGNYVLSGIPSDATGLSLRVLYSDNGTVVNIAIDEGQGAVINEYTGSDSVRVRLTIPAGTTVSNCVVKPMICSKAAWDVSKKFVPYAPTNQELWEFFTLVSTVLEGVL